MDHCLSYRNSRGKCTGTTTQQVSLSGHEAECGTTGGRFTSTPHIRRKSSVDARTKINNECFNGGDNAHNDEIERALAGKKRCQDKLNQLL